MDNTMKWRRYGGTAGLIASGVVAGGILAGTFSASAAETGTATSGGTGTSTAQPSQDQSQPQRSDEKLLTGDTKTKVEAAVMAKYPGATIERTETDSDGVYESHIITTAGNHVIVQVGKAFTVIGTQTGGPGGGHGPGGPGGAPSGSSGSSGGA
ncbi:MAG: hypothetical protein ACXVGD_22310 [Blastococcus sp.]